MTETEKGILLVGGTGVVGQKTAHILRQRWPQLPILIGARNKDRAEAVAVELGNARGVSVDSSRRDLGLPPGLTIGAVAMLTKDTTLNGQRYAQDRRIAFIEISSAAFEIGPQTALYSEAPQNSVVVLASNWLAGTSTFAALELASAFSRVDQIVVSALLDESDVGGAAAEEDYVRQTEATPSGLIRKEGSYLWVSGDAATGTFHAVDGRAIPAKVFGNLDVISLAAATNAANVKFQFSVGETSSRRQGQHFSHEISIAIAGRSKTGAETQVVRSIVHPGGQAPMTALSLCLQIEAVLGRGTNEYLGAGLYFPHTVVAPDHAVSELRNAGVLIEDAWGDDNDLVWSTTKGSVL